VNLYGVVLGFGSPAKTKRGDWMVSIALVDETLSLENDQVHDSVNTVNINIFAKALQDLPDIRYAGDVLRMHRVQLRKWKDEMQLTGLRMSSYVVCRDGGIVPGGSSGWSIEPTARTEFSLTLADERQFMALWEWGQSRLLSHPSMKVSQSFKLCEMQRQDHDQLETYGDEHTRGDLTVMVASIIPVPEESSTSGVTPCGFLRVWDGTGFPASDPLPLATAAASDAVKNGDPPSEAIIAMAAIIKNLIRCRPDSNILPPKALTGRVANVAIWEDSHWQLVTKVVRAGSFIRLRNVQDSKMESGLRCLMVFSKSYLTPLPGLTYEVVELLHNHNERILGNEPLNPQSGILPLVSGEATAIATTATANSAAELDSNLPEPPRVATLTGTGAVNIDGSTGSLITPPPGVCHELADLLAGPVPTLFSGPVRIVSTIPSVSSLSSAGIQRICHKETGTGAMVYRFAVRLQQQGGGHSATVDAIVNGGVGESLVGMQASQAAADPTGALYNVMAVFQGKYQVHVRSVAFSGAKYFLLDSITEM
jgi:hypothetical protein